MTRSEWLRFWRNLTFWRRLLLECSVWVFLSVVIGLIFRRSLDFEWIVGGLCWGIFYAIVDHEYFARRRRLDHN